MEQDVFVVTAPSGGGKTTIMKRVRESIPTLEFSVSATTRPPRAGEVEGVDYYFLSIEDFEKKIKENAFIEWEKVYEGKYYGTLKSEIDRIYRAGHVPILDVDVNGAKSIKDKFPDAKVIFIAPPNLEILIERLNNRKTETPESISERLDRANYELSMADQFDYIVVNDNLDDAVEEVQDIILENLL